MRWILKALTKKLMSGMPFGAQLDYFFKLKVAKTVPFNDTEFYHRVSIAARHWDAFKRYCPQNNLSKNQFFEFGAGWDLIIPLTYYVLGVHSQTVVDIRKNVRWELVNDAIDKFIRYREEVSRILDKEVDLNPSVLGSSKDLFYQFGINYLAPYHARNKLLPSNSFDFISNTATLEHIPESDLYGMLKECHRLLKPEGIMSCRIDLKDHYSYFDSQISHYNFLKFSERTWCLLNSSLHFQNRLRSRNYEEIATKVGFEILDKEEVLPDSNDIKILEKIKICRTFKGKYNLQELGIKDLHLNLRKPF